MCDSLEEKASADVVDLPQVRVQLEELQGQLKVMRTDADDQMMNAELENAMHIISEHSRTMNIQQYFTDQIEQLRAENQQLKTALTQAELRVSTTEREKACQQAALSQKICNVGRLTLEKQQMSAELGVRFVQLTQLKEGQEVLKELLCSKSLELEQQNLKLKTELKTVRAELKQANSSLKTLQVAEGYGLKVALGLQKQITAKREQIDFMRSRIQQLEENIEKLKMEKHHQTLLVKKQTQDLMSERESRRSLECEVKDLCSQERDLKAKAERLEAALYKMSESFSECQDFIQKQEQEMTKLKLQHALDIKEMQSQSWRNVLRSPVGCCTLQTHHPLTQHNVNGLMEMRVCDPAVELKSFPRELPGGIAEEQRPHTATCFRRRSEERHKSRQPTEPKDDKCSTRPARRKNSDSLRTVEPCKQNHNSPLSADENTRHFRAGPMCSSCSDRTPERRSPVHLLLTSHLPADRSYWHEMDNPTNANPITAKQSR